MKPWILALTLLVLAFSAACSAPTAAPPTAPAQTSATGPAVVGSATPVPPTSAASVAPTARGTATTAASPTPAPSATPKPSATADAAIAGGLVGLWQGNNNSFYLFNKDGTWSWDQTGQKVLTAPENQGRWWLEGDVIHIQDVSGLAPCPLADIGTYQAHLSGDSLELAAVGDPCTVRIAQTSGTYARQPAGP